MICSVAESNHAAVHPMDEPPAQVPRHTTSLTRLWRRHDLADSVTKFLPTQALAVLPTCRARSSRTSSACCSWPCARREFAANCTGALLSTLQTSGRDAGHHRTVLMEREPGAPKAGGSWGRAKDHAESGECAAYIHCV